MDILNIADEPVFDERIVKYEMHTYNPYANTTLGHSDEIRIPIQQQDLYTLPCESFLYIEGKLVTPTDEGRDNVCIIGNNCASCLLKCDTNSTLKSIVIETLEQRARSKTIYR